MKRFYLLLILFLVSFNGRVYGAGNYNFNLDIGEYRSNLYQDLLFDQGGNLGDYWLRGKVQFTNRYTIRMGSWDDGDWEVGDYSLELRRSNNSLKFGYLNISSPSRFLSSGRVKGVELYRGDINFWAGEVRSYGTGFSSGDKKGQLGLSYSGDRGDLTYLLESSYDYITGEDLNRSYISYKDNYSIRDSYLSVEGVFGLESGSSSLGLAQELNFNSRFKGGGYNLGFIYRNGEFNRLESSFDGYGNYEASLRLFKSFSKYYIENNTTYKESGIGRKEGFIYRTLSNNSRITYYDSNGGRYSGALSYNLDLKEDIGGEVDSSKERDISASLSYQRDKLDYSISLKRDNLAIESNYRFDSRYKVGGDYDFDLKDKKGSNSRVYLNYDSLLLNSIKYGFKSSLNYRDNLNLKLNQEFDYSIRANSNLRLNLGLSRDIDRSSGWNRGLNIGYRLDF